MKQKCRRMLALLCIVALILCITNCGKGGVLQSETQETETSKAMEESKTLEESGYIEPNQATQENVLPNDDKVAEGDNVSQETSSQEQEAISDDTVNYGDTITISCTVSEQPIMWEESGEAVFEVSTSSVQFQNEFDLAEEVTMEKVQEAIGKFPGDSFTLVFEGGDGQYFYEYTIQEILDKPADTAAYGDKVCASYEMKSFGVDRPGELETGEHILHLVDTDLFLASDETEYSTDIAKERINNIVGKGVGDKFALGQSAPEYGENYRYTITGIDKAVEYGDTIKTTVRQACILAGEEEMVSNQENLELQLLAPQGTIDIADYELNMADSMMFLKSIQEMHIGDRGYFYTLSDSVRRNYQICIQGIVPGAVSEAAHDAERLMLSEEENSIYFCNDDEKAPIVYAIVTDAQNHMVYHYWGGSGSDYYCEWSYGYTPEYDEQDRLIKEIYHYQGNEYIYEYKYNEKDAGVEKICTNSYDENVEHEYYDEKGGLLRLESYHANGEKSIREYEEYREVMTVYDAQGEVDYTHIWEYDELGMLRREEVHYADGGKFIGTYDEWIAPMVFKYYESGKKYIREYADGNIYEYETTYYDEAGNVISEEEYHSLKSPE